MMNRNARIARWALVALVGLSPSARSQDAPAAPNPEARARPDAEPTILTVEGSPTILMVVARGRDRVTMIDPETQERASIRLAAPAEAGGKGKGVKAGHTYVPDFEPLAADFDGASEKAKRRMDGLIWLEVDGPPTRQVTLFDRRKMAWIEHDLPTPMAHQAPEFTRYSPLVAFAGELAGPADELAVYDAEKETWPTLKLPRPARGRVLAATSIHGTVSYQVDGLVCVYNRKLDRWATLELKPRAEAGNGSKASAEIDGRCRDFQDGKLIVPEGDVIHIYSLKTGDWSHIDTAADDEGDRKAAEAGR